MQDTPAPKKRDYSGRVYKPRKCEDCPAVFTPGSSGQKRCPACQRENTLRLKREDQNRRNDAKREPRYCAKCGAKLPVYRGNHSRHCDACRPLHRKDVSRESHRRAVDSGRNKANQHRYRLANLELVRDSNRRYKQAHPEVDAAALHRRRMRLEAGRLDDLDRLLSRLYRRAIRHDPCFYCGSPDTQCVDHYFAIAKGGSDRWFNLVRACRSCNLSKRTMCGTAFLLLTGG
jgi:hypothetical protein